jgi:methyl-accepting chemotaxis protein
MSILSSPFSSSSTRARSTPPPGKSGDAASLSDQLAEVEARDQALVACIEAIIDGRLDVGRPTARDPLSDAVGRLLERLASGASRDLDRVVNLSIQGSETAISTARLLYASREVDKRTQTLAAASEELVASIGQIRTTAQAATVDAAAMRGSAEQGMSTADSASAAMSRVGTTAKLASEKITALSEASEAIGAIVSSIDAIAKQTNLLALNAAIEAARAGEAGEAGEGFAVVATEVKGLSQQTSRATVDIRARIDQLRPDIRTIVEAVSDCTHAAEDSRDVVASLGEAMAGVGKQVSSVTGGMADIAGILNQQTDASREIAQGISSIAAMTEQSVEQVGAISNQLDVVHGLVGAALQDLSNFSFENKIPRLAKADHVIWKKRLADMAVGRVTLKADELADHHSCRLGKWYYSDASRDSRSHHAFALLEKPHALVHQHGKHAAKLFEAGDLPGALQEIQRVEAASTEVLQLLDQLGK